MIIIIASLILWIIFACLDGFLQGYYYDLYPSDKGHKNLHPFYMVQRFIVVSLMWYNTYADYGIANAFIFCTGLCFMFSFFHNGIYYVTRHKLNNKVYPRGFWDHSETSTALVELGTAFRTAMAIVGSFFILAVVLDMLSQIN